MNMDFHSSDIVTGGLNHIKPNVKNISFNLKNQPNHKEKQTPFSMKFYFLVFSFLISIQTPLIYKIDNIAAIFLKENVVDLLC